MDGDSKTTAPASGRHYNPADVPPSLTEPSQLPQPMVSVSIEHSDQNLAPVQPLMPTLPTPQVNAMPLSPASDTQQREPEPVASNNLQPQVATPAEGFYRPAPARPQAPEYSLPDEPTVSSQSNQEVSWVSSGDSLQSRSSSWRLRMSFLSVLLGVVIYFITRDVVSSSAVAFAGLLFGFLGARKPPALMYQLNQRGIMVGQRYYGYGDFRAFSVEDETVSLVPLKRFSPILSLHLDYQQHDAIVEVLASHLPMETRKRDAMDMIINKVKF